MSLPNRIAAYDDCLNIFEAALRDGGVRVAFKDYGEARHFGLRMNNARALQREEASRIYHESDKRHGQSIYDKLTVRQPVADETGEWWIYVEPYHSKILAIERLKSKDDKTLMLEGPDHAN